MFQEKNNFTFRSRNIFMENRDSEKEKTFKYAQEMRERIEIQKRKKEELKNDESPSKIERENSVRRSHIQDQSININENIVLDMSDLLTTLMLNVKRSKEFYNAFMSLKYLYDSIGYYTYKDLDFKQIWICSILTSVNLIHLEQKEDSEEIDNLIYRIRKVLEDVEKYMTDTYGDSKQYHIGIGINAIPEYFNEKTQIEQEVKNLIWRFGCCLALQLRAGAERQHRLLQFMFEFFNSLNREIYGSQEISTIEAKLPKSEEEFKIISNKVGTVKYPLDIIKNEFTYTVSELKKVFTH